MKEGGGKRFGGEVFDMKTAGYIDSLCRTWGNLGALVAGFLDDVPPGKVQGAKGGAENKD